MNRRQRKKLYLEEFAVLGFEFSCTINREADITTDAFFDSLISLLSSRNLMIDGDGSDYEFVGYITSNERYGSATQEDIAAVKTWLESTSGIEDVKVFELTDVFYGN